MPNQQYNPNSELTLVNGNQALLFHYVQRYKTARSVMNQKVLIPSCQDEGTLGSKTHPSYGIPHVNFTTARPEEGRDEIAGSTGLGTWEIKYGLELLVDIKYLKQAFEHMPWAYQIFSVFPVEVSVVRLWDVSNIDGGWTIRRFIGDNGLPYAFYTRTENSER